MTRTVVAACLLTVVICLPAASEGQQYWGGNSWQQYWQPSRNPNCERAYPAKETNGYVHTCRYVCVGLPVRFNFEEDGTPCYVDRWQPGTCYAGRCRRAWWPPAPVTASRVASTTAPATTSEAKPSDNEAQNVDRQGCPRAYPATAVRRSCRYMCQGWPLRHQNEVDGTPCQLSSWREGFCYLGHCQKNFPVPKPLQNEDNNVEGNQGSSARSLRCRNYRGRETVDGAVRSCTFVCKRRKNAFLAVEDNGTPCWAFQGQRGYCDQGVCKAVEVQASTTAAEPAQTEASPTESPATQPGTSTAPPDTDATTAAKTPATATGAPVTDPATVSATQTAVTASPAPRSPWVPGFVGVKCNRAFPAKTLDGQVTSCRYLCEGYPRLRIGFEADGTPCLKKKTTPGVCSSGFCKPLPPPTQEPAAEDDSTTRTPTPAGEFATDDFFLTTAPSTTGDNEGAEGAATLPAEPSTSHDIDVSNGTPTSAAEGSQTTAAQDSSLVTDATGAGETDLQAGTTVDVTASTESSGLPETTEKKEELPEQQSSATSAVEANTPEGFTESDVVGGATTAAGVETTAEERGVTASTEEAARAETTGVDTGSIFTTLPGLRTTTAKVGEEAAHEQSPEGMTPPSATEHIAEVSTDAATVKEDTGTEVVTQSNDDLGGRAQEKETTATSGSKVAESEVVETKTTVLDAVTEGKSDDTTEEAVAQATEQPEQAYATSSTPVGSAQEESTFSTQALPDHSDVVTVEANTSQDVDSPVTGPVSVETSSEAVVNNELSTKSDSSVNTDGSAVTENGVDGVTEVVATEEAVVSAAAAQTTDVFEGRTEELGLASTSSPHDVSADSAAGVTVATNAATIATDDGERRSEEQPTAEHVSEPIGTQESTEASSGLNDVSVSTVVDPQLAETETATQQQDSETGEVVWTASSGEEHVSDAIVTAGAQSTPAPVVDVTRENEPLTVADAVTTAAAEEATVAAVDTTAAAAVAVQERTTHADLDHDIGADTTTASTPGATVVFVEKSSQVIVSEAVTEAREEVASTSLPDAREGEAREEVTTALPEEVVTAGNTESTTPADESATVKVITTITRKEIVRPVDPNVEQANLTSVDTTRSTSVETLPASETSPNTESGLPVEAAATISDSPATESPKEVSTGPVPAAVSDGITESSAVEEESATVKVITTITRTEIVRPVDPDATQDDVISVQKTRSSSVETLPVSDSNSPTTADSVAEDTATSADESGPPTTEDTGVVSSGPHIIITDFVQKSAASSKEPVTVPTAED